MLSNLWNLLTDYLAANSFASGGLFIAALGSIAVYCRRFPVWVWRGVYRRVVLELDVDSEVPVFAALDYWFQTQKYAAKTRRLRLVRNPRVDPELGDRGQSYFAVPGDGQHLLRDGGFWVWVSHSREKLEAAGYRSESAYNRNYTLRTFFWNRRKLLELISAQEAFWHLKAQDVVTVYASDQSQWSYLVEVERRDRASVVYDAGVVEEVFRDVEHFLARRSWYQDRGIPWRRGYLLSGPPGTGKSTLALVLASELRLPVYVLSLTSSSMNDRSLMQLAAQLPLRCLLLLEDVDVMFADDRKAGTDSKVTFSGLINALDGMGAGAGRLLVLTTNHPERLDSALIRPGRVDRHVSFGPCSPHQAEQLFLRFFPESPEMARIMSNWAGNGDYTPAMLQEHLITHCESPEEAAKPNGIKSINGNGTTTTAGFSGISAAAAAAADEPEFESASALSLQTSKKRKRRRRQI